MVLVVKPFTPGEDAVMAWAQSQDGSELIDVLALADGRDYMVLRRLHTKQSFREALAESSAYAEGLLRAAERNMTQATR